jgi:hypothetical protein
MANTVNNTLNKIGDVVEDIMSTKRSVIPVAPVVHKQTCLEQFGMQAREEHLFRNEWQKNLQYTKTLVDAEYSIQTEFKVASYEDLLLESNKKTDLKNLYDQKNRVEKRIEMLESSTNTKQIV